MPPTRPLLALHHLLLRPPARPQPHTLPHTHLFTPSTTTTRRPLTQPHHPAVTPPSPRPYTYPDLVALTHQPTRTRLIIDVREPAELAATGRIPGAYNMPLTSNPDAFHLSAEDFYTRFGFAKPVAMKTVGGVTEREEGEEGVEEVVFYCKAGVRSRAAARLAREWEGVKVGDFEGGWKDWEGRGGEVERG